MTTILGVEPQLFATDLAASRDFYVHQLGFSVAFAHGEPAHYLQVQRDGVRLNLRHADEPAFAATFRARESDALSATLLLADAQPLFDEFERRGVTFHQRLRDEPWGARTFIVADPDGNLLCFAGPAKG